MPSVLALTLLHALLQLALLVLGAAVLLRALRTTSEQGAPRGSDTPGSDGPASGHSRS